MEIVNKLLYIIYFLSLLNIIKHLFLFIQHISKAEIKKYQINKTSVLFLGLSISYLLMSIINGITI